MSALRRAWLRFWNALRPDRSEPDLAREIDSHLGLLEEDFRRRGLPPEKAKLTARRVFGGVEHTNDQNRDARSFVWIDDIRHDVAYAVRAARRSPGFSLVGVALMALGIGASTAVFSVVNAILLNPLPYPNPERIVLLSTSVAGMETRPIRGQIADADFEDWRAQDRSFDAMAYFFARATAVVVGDQAEYARVGRISGEFLCVFGVHPIAGRRFDPEEIGPRPSAAVAIVSPAFAQRHFGGSVEAIGQSIRLANRSCVIVGVTPADLGFPEGTEIWAPLALPAVVRRPERGGLNFRAVGRLRAGVRGALPVAIVNAAMVRQFWPDRNPIGAHVVLFPGFVPDDDPPRRIVGIVEDVRDGLPLTVAPRPTVYVPLEQAPDRMLRTEPLAWLVRAQTDPSLIVRSVEQEMGRASGGLALSNMQTMEAIKAQSAVPSRFITVLMTTFGGSALVLAAVGVYGLMSYTVQRRTREIAIRMALGAQPRRVRNLMLAQGVKVIGVGTVIGLAVSWALARVLAGFLFTVTPHDPLAYTVTPLILGACALIAVWIPVRRAIEVDPAAAFRCE